MQHLGMEYLDQVAVNLLRCSIDLHIVFYFYELMQKIIGQNASTDAENCWINIASRKTSLGFQRGCFHSTSFCPSLNICCHTNIRILNRVWSPILVAPKAQKSCLYLIYPLTNCSLKIAKGTFDLF